MELRAIEHKIHDRYMRIVYVLVDSSALSCVARGRKQHLRPHARMAILLEKERNRIGSSALN